MPATYGRMWFWAGRLAQLVRALARQARGHRFESYIAQWHKAKQHNNLQQVRHCFAAMPQLRNSMSTASGSAAMVSVSVAPHGNYADWLRARSGSGPAHCRPPGHQDDATLLSRRKRDCQTGSSIPECVGSKFYFHYEGTGTVPVAQRMPFLLILKKLKMKRKIERHAFE